MFIRNAGRTLTTAIAWLLLAALGLPASAAASPPRASSTDPCKEVKADGRMGLAPGCLSDKDIAPCSQLLEKGLAIDIESWKGRPKGEELKRMTLLEYALATPPYKPLYDLKSTREFMKSWRQNVAILKAGDEQRMASVIGRVFRGKELEDRLAYDEKFLCMLNVRQAQLTGSAARPGSGGLPAEPGARAEVTKPAQSKGGSGPERACLSLGAAQMGAISTESSSLRNGCKVAVGYTFCVDSPNGGGVFSCKAQKFGAGLVGPGKSDGISIMGADSPFKVHWYECQAQPKRSYPAAVYGKFVGGRVVAECR